jgi:ssDNA-binding Zn-finger/Zn-ribbon topoisomerase 1
MSLQCSIFGHRYGEVVTERERRQDGSEVIVTEREVKTCTRCGDELVVSENKEVRTVEAAGDVPEAGGIGSNSHGEAMEPPSDAGEPSGQDDTVGRSGDAGNTAGDATDAAGGTGTTTDGEQDRESAGGGLDELADRATGGADAGNETADSDDTQIPDAETGEEMGPEQRTDDAIILEDDSEERDPGEWPSDWPGDEESTTDVTEDPPVEWPETEAAASDAGTDSRGTAGDPDEETEVLKDDRATTGSGRDGDPETVTDEARADGTQDEPAPDDPDIEPTKSALTIPEGEFYCPECGFTSDVEDSPLREGDFCPRCHEATIEHRAE